MSEIVCPIECVKSGCEDPPDFLTKHGTWLLTIIASSSALCGVFLTYFLKSRCSAIRTPCLSCEREVLDLQPSEIRVSSAEE